MIKILFISVPFFLSSIDYDCVLEVREVRKNDLSEELKREALIQYLKVSITKQQKEFDKKIKKEKSFYRSVLIWAAIIINILICIIILLYRKIKFQRTFSES